MLELPPSSFHAPSESGPRNVRPGGGSCRLDGTDEFFESTVTMSCVVADSPPAATVSITVYRPADVNTCVPFTAPSWDPSPKSQSYVSAPPTAELSEPSYVTVSGSTPGIGVMIAAAVGEPSSGPGATPPSSVTTAWARSN